MKIIAITQARSGSTRLPNKILKKVGNQSLLELHVNRIKQSKLIDKLIKLPKRIIEILIERYSILERYKERILRI